MVTSILSPPSSKSEQRQQLIHDLNQYLREGREIEQLPSGTVISTNSVLLSSEAQGNADYQKFKTKPPPNAQNTPFRGRGAALKEEQSESSRDEPSRPA